MRTPYFGDTLTWKFKDSDERESYKMTRRSKPYSLHKMLWLLPLALLFLLIGIARLAIGAMTISVVYAACSQVYRWRIDRKHGLTALRLVLHPGWFSLTEQYGKEHWMRDRELGTFKTKHVRSAQWVAEGCLFIMNRWHSPVRQVLLHRGLFADNRSMKPLYRWAEEHKITIDGVPPLPGGYLRPIEEQRGL